MEKTERQTVHNVLPMVDIEISQYTRLMDDLKRKMVELESLKLVERVKELEALAMKLHKQVESYELKYVIALMELERTTQVITDKSNEVERWKRMYVELEDQNKKDIEKLKADYEEMLRVKINVEITNLTNIFANERKNLEDQIQQGRDHAEKEAKEKSNLNNHIGDLRKKIEELENNLRMFGTEIERLKEVVANVNRDAEFWKNKSANLEKLMREELEKARVAAENDKKQAVEHERKEGDGRLAAAKSSADSQIKTLKGKIIDLENKILYLEKELARLRKVLADKDAEIEELKEKYARLEMNSKKEFEEIRIEFENYKMTAIDPNEMEKRFKAERTAYEAQILQLKQKISELQKELSLSIGENDKLHRLTAERLKEIEAYKLKYRDSVPAEEVAELRKELEIANNSKSQIKEVTLRFNSEINRLKMEINNLKAMLEIAIKEKEDAFDLIESNKSESKHSNVEVERYKLENSQLKNKIQHLEGDLLTKNEQYHSMMRERDEARSEKESAKMHSDAISKEMAIKNREMMDKFAELDQLKAQYDKVLRENQEGMNSKIAKMSIVVGQEEFHHSLNPNFGSH